MVTLEDDEFSKILLMNTLACYLNESSVHDYISSICLFNQNLIQEFTMRFEPLTFRRRLLQYQHGNYSHDHLLQRLSICMVKPSVP